MWDTWSFPGGYHFFKKFQTSTHISLFQQHRELPFFGDSRSQRGLCWTDIHWFDAIQLRQPHRSCEQNTGWKCSPSRCGRKAQELTDPKHVKTSWNNKKETFTVFLNLFDRYTQRKSNKSWVEIYFLWDLSGFCRANQQELPRWILYEAMPLGSWRDLSQSALKPTGIAYVWWAPSGWL